MKPIKNEVDYEISLERAFKLIQMDLKDNSNELDELETISILIEDYEKKNYIMEAPDPVEAIKFRMEQMNLSKKDLSEILGYKSRVPEILNRKRKLSLEMISKLNEKLGISLDILIKAY
ncbi:MAG: helix-turn-helix domain-containing protein [Candidatus Sericytochromatia bacterium]|nr:helix-turn-helix domain-containing protein [Candidatus Sericytochromatia bacterium]